MPDQRPVMDITELVGQYHQAVYRYAYRLSGTEHDAEDLTQAVFLTAQEKLPQLRDPDAARSWLFTILKHRFLKTRQRQRPMLAGSLQLNIENVPAEVPRAEEIDKVELQRAIDELPPEHRVVLVMFYFEDCSYREIAERLAMPIGTVMSRLARAKARLRDRLFRSEPGKRPTRARVTAK